MRLLFTQVSSDLSIVDVDVPFNLMRAVAATTIIYCNLVLLAIVTWQVLIVAIPMVLLAIHLQVNYRFSLEAVDAKQA